MSMHIPSTRVLFTYRQGFALLVSAILAAGHFAAHAGGAGPVGTASDASVAETAATDGAGSGPTVNLFYSPKALERNPISSFMYFVPLISLTLVDRQSSPSEEALVSVISYEHRIDGESFRVICEFEIRGNGFHKISFDPAGAIALRIRELEADKPLTKVLDYIKLEGEGFGHIEVEGRLRDSVETVTEVNLLFNARGKVSPVTIGLYDITPKDGLYEYENRSNESVARVNTLAFKKSDRAPRMGVTVASITKAAAPEDFFARIKGTVANLLIKPPKIAKLGNETMLNFGYAILKQKPEFTFPLAQNIKQDKTLATLPPAPSGVSR